MIITKMSTAESSKNLSKFLTKLISGMAENIKLDDINDVRDQLNVEINQKIK